MPAVQFRIHPEILDCKRVLEAKLAEASNWRKAMLDKLSDSIMKIEHLPDNANRQRRAEEISCGNRCDFGEPYHWRRF
jgi:hypothetical protein